MASSRGWLGRLCVVEVTFSVGILWLVRRRAPSGGGTPSCLVYGADPTAINWSAMISAAGTSYGLKVE